MSITGRGTAVYITGGYSRRAVLFMTAFAMIARNVAAGSRLSIERMLSFVVGHVRCDGIASTAVIGKRFSLVVDLHAQWLDVIEQYMPKEFAKVTT